MQDDISAPPESVFAWFTDPARMTDLQDRPIRGSVIDRKWELRHDGDLATITASWMQADGTRID